MEYIRFTRRWDLDVISYNYNTDKKRVKEEKTVRQFSRINPYRIESCRVVSKGIYNIKLWAKDGLGDLLKGVSSDFFDFLTLEEAQEIKRSLNIGRPVKKVVKKETEKIIAAKKPAKKEKAAKKAPRKRMRNTKKQIFIDGEVRTRETIKNVIEDNIEKSE